MIERANYLLARAFLAYLSGVMRTKAVSVDRYWFYLRHTILWLDDTPAGRAGSRTPSLRDYIDALQRQRNMSAQTAHKILQLSRRFFEWCKARRAHEFGALSRDWISSLRLERGVIQQTRAERHYFTLDECRQIAAHDIPAGDLAMRRDQAAACLLFLSGMRVGALVTLPIACVNLASLAIQQFPSAGVHTKNSKHATTYLFNIPELLDALTRWDAFVRTRLPETATWYAHVQRHWYEQSLVDSAPAPSRAGDFNKRSTTFS